MFNQKNNKNLNIYKILAASVIYACVCLFSPVPAFASLSGETLDSGVSDISLFGVTDFAAGLSGLYEDVFVKTIQKFNIANNDKDSSNELTDSLQLLSVGFSNVETTAALSAQAFEGDLDDPDADVEAEVIGEALVYPNPFRQNSDYGAQLGYKLSKDMDLEIHVYDMLSRLILKRTFSEGAVGARKGYNKLQINKDTFDGHLLSAGVYFYILIHDGEVMERGKMAVKP